MSRSTCEARQLTSAPLLDKLIFPASIRVQSICQADWLTPDSTFWDCRHDASASWHAEVHYMVHGWFRRFAAKQGVYTP